jgi:hypothetical protein
MLAAWLKLFKKLSLRVHTVTHFTLADIWGDPQVAVYGLPLIANSATARALIAEGVLHVSQLWNCQTGNWHPVSKFLSLPTLRTQDAFCRLIEALKRHSSFAPATSPFSLVSHEGFTFVFDNSPSDSPLVYSISPSQQNLLIPCLAPTLLLISTFLPTSILQDRPTLAKSPQLHDYSNMPNLLFCLSQATLPSGIPLFCAKLSDFCKLTLPSPKLVHHCLSY